jgi:hypothetical protein
MKQTPKEKIERFLKSKDEHLPVIFCVRCGSTHLDQNFIDELRCYECGNVSRHWNGKKFSIARNIKVQDVVRAVRG